MTPPRSWRLLDSVTLLLLGAATLLSRLPYLAPLINSHDAVNYALALSHYDVTLHQPHPPGYPLYILLAKALLPLAGSPAAALTWLSALASALAVCAAYLAGRRIWGRSAGLTAALLLGTSPLIWFLGAQPLPYTVDLLLSTLAGWACFRAMGDTRLSTILYAGAAVGAAAALRQQNAVLLSGLLLAAVWARPWLHRAVGLGAAALLTLAALIGPALLSGGLGPYWAAVTEVAPRLADAAPLGQGLPPGVGARVLGRLANHTASAAGLAALPLMAAGALLAVMAALSGRDRRTPLFLLLWAAPAWAFFLLIKQGNQATVLVCAAPLFLLAGLAVARLSALGPAGRWIGPALAGGLALYQTLLFTTALDLPGAGSRWLVRAVTLERHQRDLALRLDHIRRLPAPDTVIIAHDARMLAYHLPDRIVLTPPRFASGSPRTIQEVVRRFRGQSAVMEQVPGGELVQGRTRHLVLYDISYRPSGAAPTEVKRVGIRYPLMKSMHLAPGVGVTFHSAGMEFGPSEPRAR